MWPLDGPAQQLIEQLDLWFVRRILLCQIKQRLRRYGMIYFPNLAQRFLGTRSATAVIASNTASISSTLVCKMQEGHWSCLQEIIDTPHLKVRERCAQLPHVKHKWTVWLSRCALEGTTGTVHRKLRERPAERIARGKPLFNGALSRKLDGDFKIYEVDARTRG